jgi:uncharacterized repeat protein (TIGR01451 family)
VSLKLVKKTNGTDNNVAPGPTVAVGSTVTWTYVVTNSSSMTLSNVTVTDNKVLSTAIHCVTGSGSNVIATMAAGASATCTATGKALAGQYTNIGTVTATPPVGVKITAADPDNYFGSLACVTGTLNFTGNDPTSGGAGNVKSFGVSGGVNVHVSAFSQNKSTGAFSSAYLGAYGPGLGVTDTSSPNEGNGANDLHTVGNAVQNDYLLFEFDRKIVSDKVSLGYIVGDSDMSVWIGNAPAGADPFTTHQTLNATLLSSLGFTETNDSGVTSGSRMADINAGKVVGNILVVAAKIGDSLDKFKVNQVVIACQP